MPILRSRILAALLLLSGIPSGARAQSPYEPLQPDSVLAPAGMPRIVRLPAPAPGVVSLRLSIPLDERPSEAGAGRLLEALALARMRGPADALGARLESGRTPWGLVYTVTGATADLDYLVYLLREGVRSPEADAGALATARQGLAERLRRLDETGGGRIEAALRTAASGLPPLDGTLGTVPGITVGAVRALWARSHRPDALTLLVAGDVAEPVLLATLTGLGAGADVPSTLPPDAGAPSAPPPGRVETLRHWHGVAWANPAPLDPRAAVAAVLLSRRLREERSTYEAEVRLWETPGHTVIAVIGAAYPRQAAALRQRLDGLLASTAADLEPGEVEAVARRAHRDLLLQARTPWGRVHLVGRFLDAGQDGAAVAAYLDALASLDEGAVRAFLDELAGTRPLTAEVRP